MVDTIRQRKSLTFSDLVGMRIGLYIKTKRNAKGKINLSKRVYGWMDTVNRKIMFKFNFMKVWGEISRMRFIGHNLNFRFLIYYLKPKPNT